MWWWPITDIHNFFGTRLEFCSCVSGKSEFSGNTRMFNYTCSIVVNSFSKFLNLKIKQQKWNVCMYLIGINLRDYSSHASLETTWHLSLSTFIREKFYYIMYFVNNHLKLSITLFQFTRVSKILILMNGSLFFLNSCIMIIHSIFIWFFFVHSWLYYLIKESRAIRKEIPNYFRATNFK